MINDITPEQVAEGRRAVLTVLGAMLSDDDEVVGLASLALKTPLDADVAVFGALSLLLEVLGEHGEDLAGWTARKQDQAALAADG